MEKVAAIKLLRTSRKYKEFTFLDGLLDLLRPEIIITPSKIDQNLLGLGISRFGGVPDLPDAFPLHSFQEQSLQFLAQINLSQLREMGIESLLPDSGWLYFFFNQKSLESGRKISKEDCKVIYVNAPVETLKRFSSDNVPSCFQLQFNQIYLLPDPNTEAIVASLQSLDAAFKQKRTLKIERQLAVFRERYRAENLKPVSPLEWCDLSAEERKKHEEVMALHPENVFNEFRDFDELPSNIYSNFESFFRDKQLKKENLNDNFYLLGEPNGWQIYDIEDRELLLNLDVTYGKSKSFPPEWTWGGQLMFFVPKNDLKKGCFDNVICELDFD